MLTQAQPAKTVSSGADYTLLMKQLADAVIQDSENPKIRNVLGRKQVWEKLSTEQALKWAGFAQIAGMMDTAIEVYQFLIKKDPSFEPAWKEYIELLEILDKKQSLASAIRQAKLVLPDRPVHSWLRQEPVRHEPKQTEDIDTASTPFLEMNERQRLVENYRCLFSGRADVFARQWADRKESKSGYVPVRRPMDIPDIEEHLKGLKTYGFYMMAEDATVRCGVIDADLVQSLRNGSADAAARNQIKKEQSYMVSRIRESSVQMGLNPVIEVSGYKGLHFWYFMEGPVPAQVLRSALNQVVQPLSPDLHCFDLEVFPKQDHLTGKGLGNLVKLPLGIHRLSGKRSFFPESPEKDILSQLAYLDSVKKSSLARIAGAVEQADAKKLVLYPRMQAFSEKYPDLFELERCCPPLGQITAMMREGRPISAREEKIIFQTIGFLPGAGTLLHYLMSSQPEYNPHMVDYKLSRLRGTPLGCRRIHSLTGFSGNYCDMEPDAVSYLHPLIHLASWNRISEKKTHKSEKIENLKDALENMRTAIIQIEKFIS